MAQMLQCEHAQGSQKTESGRSLQLPGAMKFAGEGGIPNPLIM